MNLMQDLRKESFRAIEDNHGGTIVAKKLETSTERKFVLATQPLPTKELFEKSPE